MFFALLALSSAIAGVVLAEQSGLTLSTSPIRTAATSKADSRPVGRSLVESKPGDHVIADSI